jgi:Amiloride-sensitive sodium channel
LDFTTEVFLFNSDLNYRVESDDEPIPRHASSVIDNAYFDFMDFKMANSSIDFVAQSGCLMIVHPSHELPSDSSFHFYQMMQYWMIDVFPRQTLVSDEVKQMSIQRRNCYLEHEKTLELFQVYSKQNCQHECQSFEFARRCGCVPFYLLSELLIKTDFCRNLQFPFQENQTTRFADKPMANAFKQRNS